MTTEGWNPRNGNVAPQNASPTTEAEVMSSADRLVLTPEEVARMLGLHANSVYAMLKRGELPSVRAGRKWLIPKRRLQIWLGGEEA